MTLTVQCCDLAYCLIGTPPHLYLSWSLAVLSTQEGILDSPEQAERPTRQPAYEPDGLEVAASSKTSGSDGHDRELSAILDEALGLDQAEVISRPPPPVEHSPAAEGSTTDHSKESEGLSDLDSLEGEDDKQQSAEVGTEMVPTSDDSASPQLSRQQQTQDAMQTQEQQLPQQQQQQEHLQQQQAMIQQDQQAAQPLLVKANGYMSYLTPEWVWKQAPIIDLEQDPQQSEQHAPGKASQAINKCSVCPTACKRTLAAACSVIHTTFVPDHSATGFSGVVIAGLDAGGSSSRKRRAEEAGGASAEDDDAKRSRLYSRALTSILYGFKIVGDDSASWEESIAVPAEVALHGCPAGAALEIVPEEERQQQQQQVLLAGDMMQLDDNDGEPAAMPGGRQQQ